MSTRLTGLTRHKNGTYYLRQRIPTDLQAWAQSQGMGKTEVTKSLHTADHRTAVERFHIENGKLQATWRTRRQQVLDFAARRHVEAVQVIAELTPELVNTITTHVEAASLAGDEARRVNGYTSDETEVEGRPPAYTQEEVSEYRSAYAEVLEDLGDAVARGDMTVLEPLCTQFLSVYGYENRLGAQDFKQLAVAYGRALLRTNEKLLRRLKGEEVATPSNPTQTSPLFGAVVKDYIAKYPAKKQAEMFKKVVPVLTMAVEVIGNRPIHTLRQGDFNRFFELVGHRQVSPSTNSQRREARWQSHKDMGTRTGPGMRRYLLSTSTNVLAGKFQDRTINRSLPCPSAYAACRFTGRPRNATASETRQGLPSSSKTSGRSPPGTALATYRRSTAPCGRSSAGRPSWFSGSLMP